MQKTKEKIHVYSSGATAPPLKRAAKVFSDKFGVEFEFTIGRAEELVRKILKTEHGDILQCGAEFLLDDAEWKGLIIKGSRRSVGLRRSVIIVQKGNPKDIKSLEDLMREGMRVGISISGCLVGVWDDICSKAGITRGLLKNITNLADGCGDVMALIHRRKVDAIFGWNVFEHIWPKTSEAIEFPRELQVFRSTGIGILKYSDHRQLASRFLDFLVSEEGKRIYKDYGWVYGSG